MADPKNIEDVRALLKEGKVQEADDVLAILSAADAAAAERAAGKPAEPPPPRQPEAIIHDFMLVVADRSGNNPVLEQLADEYAHVTSPLKGR